MKPFYVCDKCNKIFIENVKIHYSATTKLTEDSYLAAGCDGKLKPAFFADDLLKEIEERIKNLNANVTVNGIRPKVENHDSRLITLENLADAIKSKE